MSVFFCACSSSTTTITNTGLTESADSSHSVDLPKPYETRSAINFSEVIGWPEGKTPVAPEGFVVTKFADGFNNPRWVYITPGGDVLVAEANTHVRGLNKVADKVIGKAQSENSELSGNKIWIFRDADKDGIPEERYILLKGLSRPLGMVVVKDKLYVANSSELLQFNYKSGEFSITDDPKIICKLPGGGYNNHWTRNVIANKKGTKLYVSVGSASNAGEHGMEEEIRRANILEMNPDGSGERVYASGLRNPVGMDWAPESGELWTVVNERDKLGDDLVPDYLTSVKDGGFYGWPWSYFGQNEDPRLKDKNPEMVKKAIVPEVALGSHTASLGLTFNTYNAFPEKYKNGAFIGQHGSWNRSVLSGYKVMFVPFKNGKPSGPPEDFLTGFVNDLKKEKVYGRPVCVAFMKDGSLLVTDDASNVIWRVSHKK
ncbi:MAG: sorbosone dehydrogenase family protein [Bacteroidota bacterium]|nr:sorbosone dehydrogenase family protein [Bacteroidota bacterium]